MHLLLNVSSSPETNLGCECALLQVSRSLCDQLRRLAEILFRHRRELPEMNVPELYEVHFRCYMLEFYAYDLIDACDDQEAGWSDRFHGAGRALLPAGVDPAKFKPRHTERQHQIIRYLPAASNIVRLPDDCFEFCWTASPGHSDLCITTQNVMLPELCQYLDAGKKALPPAKRRRTDQPNPVDERFNA